MVINFNFQSMKKIIPILLIALLFINCNENEDTTEVRIRVSNISQFDFSNIIVNTYNENVSFNNLNSGEVSDYKTFELAYSYAFIQLESDGNTYTLQPIDFVGETPLTNGNYTYQLDINPSSQFQEIILSLVED